MELDVDAKTIKRVELYRWRGVAWQLDVWPFVLLYVAWALLLLPQLDFMDAVIVLLGLALLHILVVLFTAWSVDFRCFMHASKVNRVREADVVKVVPAKFSGSKEVVPLVHTTLEVGSKNSISSQPEHSFEFRKQKFIFSDDTFRKLLYPSKETFGVYSRSSGYGTDAKEKAALGKWGRNVFEFPQPTFQKLMKEHCMEPFFVFQVFCVGLWCLDEYWYYSIFTLFMLILFESTVVKSRLKTLAELRRVRVDSQTIHVYRTGKWLKLSGVDLLPGDLVSIGRATGQTSEERTVPADMLLLAGTAIANEALLTGESTPQWKVSIVGRDMEEKLSIRKDKAHVLFGGTKILQHTPDKASHLKTPDGGCLAVVLRTGFETSQGKLMRTILFSTERVTANNWESGLFILFLVFFALVAAGYVLKQGLEHPTRSKFKLFLNCSMIITSVIPPELPMELSIAVNTSLIALVRRGIYCTEPFRIPFAGKVDTCCFDKTGTLTSDDMEFLGVCNVEGKGSHLESDPTKLLDRTLQILAACHALVFVDNKLVGDPLEKAALKGVDWSYTADEKAVARRGSVPAVQIIQRHHFSSSLKRMSTVVRIDENFLAFTKGAPETIQERLVHVPESYVHTYKTYTRQGARVLALAYKVLPDIPVGEARSLERQSVESDLVFCGFAVFACPLRKDSASVLKDLKDSSHDLVMITGDQALTACHVAGQVHIVSQPVLILTPPSNGQDGFNWLSPDEETKIAYEVEKIQILADNYDLCVSGDGLAMLQRTGALEPVLPFVKVYARVAPDHKELILITLKDVGRTTLMCGDGTNDVGALKQAHVGVALLNAVEVPGKSPSASSSTVKRQRAPTSSQTSRPNSAASRAEQQKQKLKQMMDEMNSDDGRSAPVVRLGDASMASAFTAKHASVQPTADIIRQGRSTLVTTLQMFKILGLNCLSTAYVLSVMYLDGVKLGDVQATISGLFTAAFFLFISNARPLSTLSAQRPHPNIFSAYVIISMLGQFAMHLCFLVSVVRAAESYMPEECVEPDSDFTPNLVNTVSYMANMMIQVATFAVNYIGHPFNQSIRENKPFFYALTAAALFFTTISSDLLRDLNDWLRLVPLPKPLGWKLLLWAGMMSLGCFVWERLLRALFPGRRPLTRSKASSNVDKKVQ
ncbi:probable manganese-transporting ATPase PDR2 isoform X2 [Selaginella moellendorffii]|uniref:probable manganese-transporting ATPase PDR2 isoform X2 n=1 Tax=Selaginella moellendorffii TaxID=88036 RepID=UPI000D1C5410|nr:probable manganese-transporting ATPase PDR2 isoform X2 [Selaginella moellendorffii]|eukprot:XP_024522453.1 probable manganese-transporting ATPase PDR2 isoform X2 [Selaginella moellendorffii]